MKITVLTPIHIGSGETLKPLSYVMDKNSLDVLNMDKFFSILSNTQREAYLGWIEPVLDKIADIDSQLDKAKDNFELKKGILQKPVNSLRKS